MTALKWVRSALRQLLHFILLFVKKHEILDTLHVFRLRKNLERELTTRNNASQNRSPMDMDIMVYRIQSQLASVIIGSNRLVRRRNFGAFRSSTLYTNDICVFHFQAIAKVHGNIRNKPKSMLLCDVLFSPSNCFKLKPSFRLVLNC